MKYKVQRFSFESGERYALLINSETGIPLIHENLYVTIHIRNTGESINTMVACLRDLRLFHEICEYMDINLEQRFAEGKALSKPEMTSISYWTKKPKVSLEAAKKVKGTGNVVAFKPNLKRLEMSRHTVLIDTALVDVMTTYNRLSNIISYTGWLAKSLAPAKSLEQLDKMVKYFRILRPVKHSKNNDSGTSTSVFKSLTESQMIRVLDIIRPDASSNPWKDEATRYRNQMIVNVLYDVGCRKGELLTIKATEIEGGSYELKIRRSADDPDDERRDEPLVKTLSRDVGVSLDVFDMVENYILTYRSQIKGSGKNPFLILSHQKGAITAKALSISGLNRMFQILSESAGFTIGSHAIRHSWNDEFSADIEAAIDAGDITEEEAEDTRSYLMGWKENSGTAKTYTKRYQKKRSLIFALKLQEKRRKKLDNIIGQYDEDVEV
ncbi:MAG: site-specific integrase [Cognaticolwellia sp.]